MPYPFISFFSCVLLYYLSYFLITWYLYFSRNCKSGHTSPCTLHWHFRGAAKRWAVLYEICPLVKKICFLFLFIRSTLCCPWPDKSDKNIANDRQNRIDLWLLEDLFFWYVAQITSLTKNIIYLVATGYNNWPLIFVTAVYFLDCTPAVRWWRCRSRSELWCSGSCCW